MTDEPKVVGGAVAANGNRYEIHEEVDRRDDRTVFTIVQTAPHHQRCGSAWSKASAVKRLDDILSLSRRIEQVAAAQKARRKP